MITERQLDALLIARERLGLDDAAFDGLLKAWGGQSSIHDVRSAEYDRILDRLVTLGFTDPHHVVVVRSDYVVTTFNLFSEILDGDYRLCWAFFAASGAVDANEISGIQLERLFDALATLGYKQTELTSALKRSVVSNKQLALLHVAKRDTNIIESYYRIALRDFGGVITDASDLDEIGFRRMLVFFEGWGFVPPSRRTKPVKRATFGRRAGMASPAQITLIRELWAEWSGADDEDALNAWLERFHHVSSLRFLTAEVAGKVITGLRAMKRRPKPAKAS